MDIFLTGATGYVGSGIAQALQQAGVETILTDLGRQSQTLHLHQWLLGAGLASARSGGR